jgi:lipopolysaccharide heptosyltransferase I
MTPISFPSPPQRILIIKPSSIGDVLHALPVLGLLRKKWPEASISWLVTPACAGLVDGHPLLDETIYFERRKFGAGWRSPRAAASFLKFTGGLRDRNFDLVIDLQGLFRSGWIAALARAPIRIGFANAREMAWLFYTHRVPIHTMEQHAIDRYLAVMEALDCGRSPVDFVFPTTDDDRAQVDEMLRGVGNFAVLLPGTNWPTKRWPAEYFAAIVAPLRERFGLQSVIAGGSDVLEIVRGIDAMNLAGKTNLRQLVALLERASLVIANDSGPMHIAAALGRPLVTPFGPTNPIRTGPYQRMGSVIRLDIPCAPCYSRKCSHQSCLKWLTIEPVLDLAAKQLAIHNVAL